MPSTCCVYTFFISTCKVSSKLLAKHQGKLAVLAAYCIDMLQSLRNWVHIMYQPSSPFPLHDIAMVLPTFLHGCEIKSGSGLGTGLLYALYLWNVLYRDSSDVYVHTWTIPWVETCKHMYFKTHNNSIIQHLISEGDYSTSTTNPPWLHNAM